MTAVLLLTAGYATAADPDLSGFKLVKTITWGSEEDITRDADNKLSIRAYETGNKKLQDLYAVTAPADAVGCIGVQATNSQDKKGWWNRPAQGLWSYNANRSAAVYGEYLTLGSVVKFTCSQDASKVMTLTNGEGNPDGPFSVQQSDDGLSYFCTITAESDGYVGFCGARSVGYIKSIEIYQPDEGEKVLKTITWGGEDDIMRDPDNKLSIRAYETGNKKLQDLYAVTAPADAVGYIGVQLTNSQDKKGWWNRPDLGLWSYNATRSAAVYGEELTAGVEVVFTCSQDATKVMTLTNGNGEPDGPFTYRLSDDGLSYICTITAEKDGYVGFCGARSVGYIKEIVIRKPGKVMVLTTYTVRYVDTEGNTLKEETQTNGFAGNDITLNSEKANITVGETTYVYESDNSEGVTIAADGSTVVTIVFHAAQNFNYTVNEVAGETVVRSTTGVNYETSTVKVPFRKYNVVDGVLYHKGDISKEYNYSFTLKEEGQQENLAYTATETTDVVFLAEGEDIEGLTPCNSANTAIRSSNSASAYAKDGDVAITTLTPGTYTITAFIYDASKSPDSHWIFKAGENEVANLNCTTVNIQELKSGEFTLTENATIYLAQGGSNTMGLDLVYITGTGKAIDTPAVETISFEIKDASGYATYFNSQKAFVMPEGVKGGIVTAVDNNMSVVDYIYSAGAVVPAGTPLFLSGDVKAYEAEVTTTDAVAPTNNQLKGYDAFTAKVEDADYFYYMLSRAEVKGEERVGFFWFNNDGHVNNCQPNKAYLCLTAEQAANSVIFIDDATGIRTATAATSSAEAYTLSGIRVSTDRLAKGIYIIGGKKVVVK